MTKLLIPKHATLISKHPVSMTMPPILFWGLEMAKKGVSIAFLSTAGPKFGSENSVFWPFLRNENFSWNCTTSNGIF